MTDRPLRRSLGSDFARLRWLGVWLPVIALGILIGLGLIGIFTVTFRVDWRIHLAAYMLVMGVITTGAYAFSYSIFRVVRQKEQEILRRNQELVTLNTVGAVINDSLNLEEVLGSALTRVLEVTKAESGEVFLWEEGGDALVLRSFQGQFPEAFREITRFKLGEGHPGRIAERGEAIVVHDLAEDPRFLREKIRQKRFQSYAGVPLKSRGTVVGVMGIFSLDPSRLTSEDVELLEALGNQIGVAIENATLYARLKTVTVMEERQRIAREMHDGLAQELGYLHIKMGELEANPSLAPLREDILLMKGVLAGAYEEVQQAIFGLKMMVSRGLGLIPSFAEYLHEFSEQTGIAVKLKVADEGATQLSPPAEIQLIRIVQEALTNVRKHARARHAWLTFETEGTQVKVTVQDDGQGFAPEKASRSGPAAFGIESMRERAESVGGAFSVQSESGTGTRVIVWLAAGREEGAVWRS